MKELYAYCHISKQSHYQALFANMAIGIQLEKVVIGLILQIREIHPAMGLRTMYTFYQPADIGRDAFIELGLLYGFRTVRRCGQILSKCQPNHIFQSV